MHSRVLPVALTLVALAAAGGAGAQGDKQAAAPVPAARPTTTVDAKLLARIAPLRPCPAERADGVDRAGWVEAIHALLGEVRTECLGRVSPDDADLCELTPEALYDLTLMHGEDCLVGTQRARAYAFFLIGDGLLRRGDARAAESLLFRAQQELDDDAIVLRRWTEALGQQLLGMALDQPLEDRYAHDILVLSSAALRFFPDHPRLQETREWAVWAVDNSRLDAAFDECKDHAREQRWTEAMAACQVVVSVEPGHIEARQLLGVLEREQDQRQRRRAVARSLALFAAALLALALFVLVQGDLFLALGKLRMALSAYGYLSAVLPTWRKPYLQMASIHHREGAARQEEEVLQRAHATWPRDTQVLQRLFEFYSRVGDMKGVRDSAIKLSGAGEIRSHLLVDLLDAQRSLGLVEDELIALIEQQRGGGNRTPLLPLLALGYAQRERYDVEAREVYEATLELPTPRLRALVPLARVELAAGRAGKAIEYAEQAVAQHPTAEAVDCLTDALLETELEEHIIWAEPPTGRILFLYPALLKVAGRRPDLAPMIVDRLRELYESTTDPGTALVTTAIMELLQGHPCREALLDAADSVDDTVPYLKAVEATFGEYARRHPDDGLLWLRLAGIHEKLERYPLAIQALERAYHIPESRSFAIRRATAMVQHLEGFEVVELLAALLGLVARPVQQSADGFVELLMTRPGKPLDGWWAALDQARVRVFSGRPPTQEDVLSLRRSLTGGERSEGLAVLVSAGRPSAGTTELIMTSMIEQPGLQMFPLDERSLRDAVAEFRPRAMLAQLRSQWLLGEDLFDKKDPVLDPAEFFGRGQVLRTLVRKAHRGEAFGLFGIRKMGKTSLAHRLRGHLVDAVVAMADLQEVSSSSCVALAQLLCDRAIEDWRAKFPERTPPELTALADADEPLVAFEHNLRTLRAAILDSAEISTLFFLIDEIENLIPHELGRGAFHDGYRDYEPFLRLLRGLHQTDFSDVFSFAVIGADAELCLQGRWGGRDNPIFQYLSEFYVGPLNASETAEMVSTLGAGMGLQYTDGALAALYDLSGGHPMVCRQLCSETAKLAGDQRPATIDTADVRAAVDSYLTLKKGYFGEILNHYLGAGQRAILDRVAASDEGQVTRTSLRDGTRRAFAAAEDFDRDLQNLELFSLLARRGDRYRFTMRLLRTYIRVRRLDIEDG